MKRKTKSLNLAELLPGPVGSIVQGAFFRMGIAEEEIAAAKLTKEQGSRVFGAACPTSVLQSQGNELYRAHVKELCERADMGTTMERATDAECLGLLMSTALVAPLGQNAQAAAERLFARLFPEQKVFAAPMEAAWPGATDEVMTDVRRKLKQKGRGT